VPSALPSPSLAALGWGDRWLAHWSTVDHPDARPARVVRHDRGAVIVADGDTVRALPSHVAGHDPVVGDWLAVLPDRIHTVLPRHGLVRRADPAGGEQVLAANVDLILIVCGLDRPVKTGRIQRATVQAWDADAVPLVVLTKADLTPDAAGTVVEIGEAISAADVLAVSSADQTGLDDLRARLTGRTSVLVGESGAGKSTLVNALLGGERMATGHVRTGDAKGRHTTTHRELHGLPDGGSLIDIPGLRSMGLAADPGAVDATFPEIEELAAGCRFHDCTHASEPQCAVIGAVQAGSLDATVLAAYHRLRHEAESEARRSVEHERRKHERAFGRVAKEAQRVKGRPKGR
jgi:ribosome biogenesis GTPase